MSDTSPVNPSVRNAPAARPAGAALTPVEPREGGGRAALTPVRFLSLLLLVTLLGAGLRVYDLNDGSLWVDEIFTARDAYRLGDLTWPRIPRYLPTRVGLELAGVPNLPPFQTERWAGLGLEPFHVRLASCAIGVVSIPVLVLVGRRLLGDPASMLMGLLLALCPWHIYWSQVGRFYTQEFLFYALALFWYWDATQSQSRTKFVLAMASVVLAFCSHPPGLVVVGVFAVDYLLGLIRRQRVKLGAFNWTLVGLALLACVSYILNQMLTGEGGAFRGFIGEDAQTAQSPAMIVANAGWMLTPSIGLLALLGIVAGLRPAPRPIVYLLAAGAMPFLAMSGIAATGGFAHSRYAFIGAFGVLALASLGLLHLYRAIEPHAGRAVAAVPILLALLPGGVLLASYYTTGHHFRERYNQAYTYVAEHREPGDRVTGHRPELGWYYLEDPNVDPPPNRMDQLIEAANGSTLWIVRLTASSGGPLRWKPADACEIEAVFALNTWMPHRELTVYKYVPPTVADVHSRSTDD